MTDIDRIIARAREPGRFVERREFTVERQAAMRKMRAFALEEPHHYVLEWVRSAVANAADVVDVRVSDDTAMVTWRGRGFERYEVQRLFDYLFASSDDLDIADLRHLALAVNALFATRPTRIVWTTGRGTTGSTTRLELDPRSGHVTVGTPANPLDGTMMRVEGMDRRTLGRWEDQEELTIHKRCYLSPIPIVFNHQRVTEAWSASRQPQLDWADRRLEIDDGDLYGSIGWRKTGHPRPFVIVHHGVVVAASHGPRGQRIADGGVLHFDRLNLTADRSRVVRDDVWDELWQRVALYTHAGEAMVTTVAGEPLTRPAMRERASAASHVIAIPKAPSTDEERARLARLTEVHGHEVWIVDPTLLQPRWIAELGDVLWIDLADTVATAFYAEPAAEPPAKPWLVGPVVLPKVRIHDLELGVLQDSDRLFNAVLEPVVYTPAAQTSRRGLRVELRVHGRQVWVGSVGSGASGHVLVAHIEGVDPTRLLPPAGSAEQGFYQVKGTHLVDVGGVIADALEEHVRAQVRRVTFSALHAAARTGVGLDNPMLRRLALKQLEAHLYMTLGFDGVALRVFGDDGRLRAAPLFQSAAGAPVSVERLEEMLNAQGVVHVVREGRRLWGRAPAEVVVIDTHDEQLLRRRLGWGAVSAVYNGSWDHLDDDVQTYVDVLSDGFDEQRPDAWRTLVHAAAVSPASSAARGLALFEKTDGTWTSMAALCAFADTHGPVPMAPGWASDTTPPKDLREGSTSFDEGDSLKVNAFVWSVLSDHVGVRAGWVDPERTTWLLHRSLATSAHTGAVGIAADAQTPRGLAIVSPEHLYTVDHVVDAMVCGAFFTTGKIHEVMAEIPDLRGGLLADLIAELRTRAEGDRRERLVHEALALLGTTLTLRSRADGSLELSADAEVDALLSLPLFPLARGGWANMRQLVEHASASLRLGAPPAWETTVDPQATVLLAWCDRYLTTRRHTLERPVVSVPPLPARWERSHAEPHRDADPNERVWAETLRFAQWLEASLATFAPAFEATRYRVTFWASLDLEAEVAREFGVRGADGKLAMMPPDRAIATFSQESHMQVALRASHALIQHIVGQPPELETATLLLLAVYGAINADRTEITDRHELLFHAAVARALLASDTHAGEAQQGG